MLDLQAAYKRTLTVPHYTLNTLGSISFVAPDFDSALGGLGAHIDSSDIEMSSPDWEDPNQGAVASRRADRSV